MNKPTSALGMIREGKIKAVGVSVMDRLSRGLKVQIARTVF
jgi:hypothetical protein